MSILGILDAMRSDRPATERLVWQCLENHANGHRWWRITEEAIAKELSLGLATVSRAVRALIADNIVRVERCKRRPTVFRMVRDYPKTNGQAPPPYGELADHPDGSNAELTTHFDVSTAPTTPELTTQTDGSSSELTTQTDHSTPELTHQIDRSLESTSKTPPKKKGPPGSRAGARPRTPLPEQWQPSVALVAFGAGLGLAEREVRLAADRMRDWSIGDGKLKADWDATFRNWLRRDASEPRRRPEHAMSKHEQIRRAGNLGTFLGPLHDDLPEQSFLRLVAT
jgi:hypothetical protein